ncbi:hypothetical protein JTE90_022769 [Oedothorax gibbosus]|uniref:SEC14-like protein 2 n=1 Tax=Oedothorax gibbosus TaxID=931172 RepID=A0AAV6U846_9ARAC|nr:hypothetical protein JTE90_022769 [Oedothorax gibbosus]
MTRAEDIYSVERSNIDKLRCRMKGLMTPELYDEDNVFERFLRARNQNLDDAELMLKHHMQWRKNNRVDTIREEFQPTEVMVKYDVMNMLCFDKEGSPVIYYPLGKFDTRGLDKCLSHRDYTLYLIQHFENFIHGMSQKSKELGKPINQWVMIFDYESFLLSNATHKPTLQFLFNVISMYEANYPERLKAAYLINGSFVFQICFSMCKPFIAGHTIQKVKIFGTDFQSELLKIIHADDLPAFLGGNRTDPDGNPRCVQTVKHGGVIPESYYRERKMSVIPGAKLLTVNRFSKEKVEVNVPYPGSSMEWRFQVRNRNINFAVFLKRSDGEEDNEEVLPRQRVETVDSSETGMCRCPKAGIYVLEFDNSFSWLHSKQVFYTVTVNRL